MVSIFVFALSALVSYADEPIFCETPYKAVCENASQTQADRDVRYSKFRAEVAKEATARNIPLNILLDQKVRNIETSVVLGNIKRIKRYFLAALAEQYKRGHLSFYEFVFMMRRIKDVEVWTTFRMSRHFDASKQLLTKQLFFSKFCGTDGMSDNAFAGEDGGVPYIVLCPGWLFRAAASTEGRQNSFLNLLFVMAHELGHHIDFEYFEQVYDDMNSCYTRYHGDKLQYGKHPVDALMSTLEKTGNVQYRWFARSHKVNQHAREITADFWAAQTVTRYLATLSSENRLHALKESFNGLCGIGDAGSHPSDEYRVDLILGGDRGIRKLMNCAVPQKKVACGLNGAETY